MLFCINELTNSTGRLSQGARVAFSASLDAPLDICGFRRLKEDVGAATLDNVLDAADRLEFKQILSLPIVAISGLNASRIKMLNRRVEGETASEMLQHREEMDLSL
ncbi:hypothetical protein, partial [uncultured Maritalea sp.]|uniref:hypothetical protein n=1 Tax=uncultured Maritalea sp. TaxID=757249 RepID=UPI0026300403